MLSVQEVVDLVIMTAALGYIFMDAFQQPSENPLEMRSSTGFDWNAFWYSTAVVAPSIVLHELAHKFTALGFGMQATFHAAIPWLLFGIVLKLLQVGVIFFVPGYVSISGMGAAWQHGLIAFAGPLVHLLVWLAVWYYFESWTVSHKQFWGLTMQVNKFLFILNMLPIPGFDGFSVYRSILAAIGIV